MKMKYGFLFILVCLITGCNNLQWEDSKKDAVERIGNGIFTDSVIVQEIGLKNYIFMVLAPPQSLEQNNDVYFAVVQILHRENDDKFASFTQQDTYIGLPSGGGIPVRTLNQTENFYLMLYNNKENANAHHDQILMNNTDDVSDIYEFNKTYFFLKYGDNPF